MKNSIKTDFKLFENKKNCCGCYACVSICPKQALSMTVDEEGFEYPTINDSKCINCGLCIRVCPIMESKKEV